MPVHPGTKCWWWYSLLNVSGGLLKPLCGCWPTHPVVTYAWIKCFESTIYCVKLLKPSYSVSPKSRMVGIIFRSPRQTVWVIWSRHLIPDTSFSPLEKLPSTTVNADTGDHVTPKIQWVPRESAKNPVNKISSSRCTSVSEFCILSHLFLTTWVRRGVILCIMTCIRRKSAGTILEALSSGPVIFTFYTYCMGSRWAFFREENCLQHCFGSWLDVLNLKTWIF